MNVRVTRATWILVAYSAAYLLSVGIAALGLGATAIVGLTGLIWMGFLCWRVVVLGTLESADVAFIVILAAFQNVVLGMISPSLNAMAVRVLISTNFILSAGWLVIVWVTRPVSWINRDAWAADGFLAALAVVVFVSIGLFGFAGVAAVASLRNIATPIVFFALGYLVVERFESDQVVWGTIVGVGVVVVAIGIIERLLVPGMWSALHVGDLWMKKGLTNLNGAGIPANWYSAERFNGEPVRRMVSTFADPVNLGTFLALLVIAGYRARRWFVTALGLLGIVLTVSKGGLLGVLILGTAIAYYRSSRVIFMAVAGVAIAAGVAFVVLSLRYATGSLLLHAAGTANAVLGLVTHPLGLGLGRVGTLAQQFTFLGQQDIVESGLGLIIGQLGVLGLVLYGSFLVFIWRSCVKHPIVDSRIVAIALLGSIALNIAFNEVALSPNSSAGYFFLLGSAVLQSRRAAHADPGKKDLARAAIS